MFKKLQNSFIFPLVILFFGASPFVSVEAQAKKARQAFERGLIVLAPASMTSAMQEILGKFSRKNNISVSATFESTLELAEQIEQGEPANIFITEDASRIKDLQQKGVLNVFSITNLISDKLVLVVPKNSFLIKKLAKYKTMQEKLKFLAKNSLVAIPDPELDMLGKNAQTAFEKLGAWEDMKAKLVKTNNSRATLYMATDGNTPAIVYASDANKNNKVRVIGEIPESLYNQVIYQIAVVADIESSSSAGDCNEFINFVKSDAAILLFEENGFVKLK